MNGRTVITFSDSGEQLKLSYGAGTPIRDFTYDDVSPWPNEANNGRALVLINPAAIPNHGVGSSWRASIAPNANPGTGDAGSFTAWAAAKGVTTPSGDDDRDGLNNLAEYTLVGLPLISSTAELPQSGTVEITSQTFPTLSFRRNLAADDVRVTVQVSSDLNTWSSTSSDVVLVSEVSHGDGTAMLTYRSATPVGGTPRQFLRVRIEQQ